MSSAELQALKYKAAELDGYVRGTMRYLKTCRGPFWVVWHAAVDRSKHYRGFDQALSALRRIANETGALVERAE